MSFEGSASKQIVNPDLVAEREKLAFDRDGMSLFVFGKDTLDTLSWWYSHVEKNEMMQFKFDWFDMTREEKMEHWMKIYNKACELDRDGFLHKPSSGFYAW
jgi:hypothetical protein